MNKAIIIAIIAVLLIGTGSAGVYVMTRPNPTASPESVTFTKEPNTTPEPIDESLLELDDLSEGQTTELAPSDTSNSTIVALVTKAAEPTKQVTNPNSSVTTDDNIPLIVEQEFIAVYGRPPNSDESAFWKERYRKNSFDRAKIRALMEAHKKEQGTTSTSEPSGKDIAKYLLLQLLKGGQVSGAMSGSSASNTTGLTQEQQELLNQQQELLERQQEEQTLMNYQHQAENIAACKKTEDTRHARAVDSAMNGLGSSGAAISARQSLDLDHEYRLLQCEGL